MRIKFSFKDTGFSQRSFQQQLFISTLSDSANTLPPFVSLLSPLFTQQDKRVERGGREGSERVEAATGE